MRSDAGHQDQAATYTPARELRDAVVLIDGENIEAVGLQATIPIPQDCEVWDVGDRIVAPGLIDLHNHGANEWVFRPRGR